MKNNDSRTVGNAASVSSLTKNTKADSLRTAKAVARFGKAARHPVCQAALQLWQFDAKLLKWAKDICSLSEILSSAKKQKKQAQALIEQFRKKRKEKEASEASALLHEIDQHLLKTEAAYRANVDVYTKWLHELRPRVAARAAREWEAVVRAGDTTKALRALQRMRKRWSANPNAIGVHLKDGDRRKLEILNMLQDEVIKAKWSKNGAAAGYWEVGAGGNRPLSDESWQGRLTAKEIQSRLVDAPGDKDAKEVRRLLEKLGIRPAEDQRGRKWESPYLKKQRPKRPRGRPHTRSDVWSHTVCVFDLEKVESILEARRRGKPLGYSLDEPALEDVLIDPDLLKVGRKDDDGAIGLFTQYSEQRFRRGTFIDKDEARRSRHENRAVYLPPNPEGWWLPLTAEQRAGVPYFASFQELKRWMDNEKRASLPCLVGSFARIKKLRRWLATEPARDSILFWNQWLTRGVRMPKALPVGILELKTEFLHNGKRITTLVWIKTKNDTPLREVQPNKESACPLGDSRGIPLTMVQGA
jgi:hypothetical protein